MANALRENTIKVEGIIAKIDARLERHYERTAQLVRGFREDTGRSITSIYTRLVSIEDTIETDRAARVIRQSALDDRLSKIEAHQRLLVRLAVIAGFVALGVVVGWLLF